MRREYRLVNVFAMERAAFTGNPLCVFEDARGLSDREMQALARQFNLSEMTFILPSERADARVRIFTPGYEMPFAGHPTLGTAHVVRSLRASGDAVTLELGVGPIAVSAAGDRWEFQARHAATRTPRASASVLASGLGLEATDVAGPVLWVDAGAEQLLVPLAGADAVRRASVGFDDLIRMTADGARPQMYLFAPDGPEALLARFFFSHSGSVIEDPATGSAAANLGGWYLARRAGLPLTRIISQGAQAARPSILRLRIDGEGRVYVAGDVVDIGAGHVDL